MLARRDIAFLQDAETIARRFRGCVVSRSQSSMRVDASGSDGFKIALYTDGASFAVSLGEWSEEFLDSDEALQLFEAAMSGEARLRVTCLASRRWRWTLERRGEDGRWVPYSTVGHVVWRFWGRQSVELLSNDFVPRSPS